MGTEDNIVASTEATLQQNVQLQVDQHTEAVEHIVQPMEQQPMVGQEKDPYIEGLLTVTSIKGEFASYKDKVAAYVNRQDESVQEEYLPLMRLLFRVGDNNYSEPSGFPDLKEYSAMKGTIQKRVMDAYFKFFKTEDFTYITKSFENGPKEGTFTGKVIKQSFLYMQFLTGRMKLGEAISLLCKYVPEELDEEEQFRIDRCLTLLEKDMASNPLKQDVPIEESLRIMSTRMSYFKSFADDCSKIYYGDKHTASEKRLQREELREKSHIYDESIDTLYHDYIGELHSFVQENDAAAEIAGAFKETEIFENGIQDLTRASRATADNYLTAYKRLDSYLCMMAPEKQEIVDQVMAYLSRQDLMLAELKDKIKKDEEVTLDVLKENITDLKSGDISPEDFDDMVEDMVENYHEIYANRNMLLKVETACASVLNNIYTVLHGYYYRDEDNSASEAITDLLNVMPIAISDREDQTSLSNTLKSCLMMTELVNTKFENDSFLEAPEVNTLAINVDEKELKSMDPNVHFDAVLEYYAPSTKNADDFGQFRRECTLEIARGKAFLEGFINNPRATHATNRVCGFMMEKIQAVDKGFEKTNNYFKNLLETTCEPGSPEAVELSEKGLKVMLSELRDYSKFMNYLVKQISDFDELSKRVEALPDGDKHLETVLSSITTMLGDQFIYTPTKDTSKLFETPELVRGKMLELTGVMQLIGAKASEIAGGREPFGELAASQRDTLKLRELQEQIKRTAIPSSAKDALKILKKQMDTLERQGERYGKGIEYTTQMSELQAKYDKIAAAARRVGEDHAKLIQEKQELERSIYLRRITVNYEPFADRKETRVLAVAKNILANRTKREFFDRSDAISLERTKSRRDKTMAEHKKQEAKHLIEEEKRQRELERAEERERQYEERMERLEARKAALQARVAEIRRSVAERFTREEAQTGEEIDPETLAAEERLSVYIPKKATGRLKDYNLKGRKISGVGKLESIGSCAASKLKDRIGKHTRRFLYSETVSAEGLNATAASIIEGVAFNTQKYKNSPSPVLDNIKLVEKINSCGSVSELKTVMEQSCQGYIRGNNQEEIDLSDRFVNANFAQTKIILMHRILLQTEMTNGQLPSLSDKDRAALADRIDASKANIGLLYNHCIHTPEYAEERAQVLIDEERSVEEQIEAASREGIRLSEYISALRDSTEAAVATMYDTCSALAVHDAEVEERATVIAQARHDEASRRLMYEDLSREIEGLAAQAEKEQREKYEQNLIENGIKMDGKVIEGWVLGAYADQVKAYLHKNLDKKSSDIVELALIGLNENARSNLESIREYLSDRMMGGGDYVYLKNPSLYEIAEKSIIEACGESLLTATSKSNMAKIIGEKSAKRLFGDYKKAVKKMLATIRRDKVLAPYAEAIMLDEDFLAATKEKDNNKLTRIIDAYKKNVEASEEIIAEKIGDFSFEERLILELNIKARLGREILKANPQSVENIVDREIDYRKLLNPVAVVNSSKIVDKAKKVLLEQREELLEIINKVKEAAKKQYDSDARADHDETDDDYLEHEVINAVGITILLDAEGIEKHCLEKLAYYIASEDKACHLESKTKEFLRDYATSRYLKMTSDDVKAANSDITATERILVKALFEEGKKKKDVRGNQVSARIRVALNDMSVETVNMVKSLVPTLCERKILSSSSFDSLAASDVYELVDYTMQRLIPFGAAITKKSEWAGDKEIKRALIKRCLDLGKSEANLGELLMIGVKEHAKLAEQKDILYRKKQLLSMGNCWRSREVYVDLVNRQLNTATGEPEFRDLNRISRVRNLDKEMTKFCEKHHCQPPISIYEFGANKENENLAEGELFEKWKAEVIFGKEGWIGGEADETKKKAKREFYDSVMHEKLGLRNMRLYAYYGMSDDLSVILKGVGDSINDDLRESFEHKLFEVNRKYQARKKYFISVCRDYHLTQVEIDKLLPNVSEHFVDIPRQAKKKKEDEDAYQEKLEQEFRKYIDSTVDLSSRYCMGIAEREKDGYQLREHEKLQAVVVRKDERLSNLALSKKGIFAPLLPYLLENYEFQDNLLCLDDEEYSQFEFKLLKKAEEPMVLLSQEGSVYNAFIEQFLIRFKAEIIGEKATPGESWKTTFAKYYAEISDHNYGTEKKPRSISQTIQDVSEKAASASAKNKDRDLDSANLVIHVLLSEGAVGVLSKDVLRKYQVNLKTNTEVLTAGLRDFYRSDAFKEYIELGEQQQSMGRVFEGKPEDELKVLFTRSVRMAERSYLVKETPEEYREHFERRLNDMLTGAVATLDASETITRLARQSHEIMDASVVETKRQGRLMMRNERAALDVYEERASHKISPVVATYLEKKDEMSVKTVRKIEIFQKEMREKLPEVGHSRDLAIEIGAAHIARGKAVSLDDMRVCCENLTMLLARISTKNEISRQIVLIRLARQIEKPFEVLSDEAVTALIGNSEAAEAVAKVYTKIVDVQKNLPQDGSLNSYYQSVRTAATYIASDGNNGEAENELMTMYRLLAKRVLMMNVISEFIEGNVDSLIKVEDTSLVAREKLVLRKGLFDYFAPEICDADLKYSEKSIRKRMSAVLGECLTNRQMREYLMDDTGHSASISSEQTVAEVGDSEYGSIVSRAIFEKSLQKYVEDKEAGEFIKQYFELAPEEKTLFGHMATSQAISDISDNSMSFVLAYGSKKNQAETDVAVGKEYVSTRIITAPVDYVRAKRALFQGKRPDASRIRMILAAVYSEHKKMLRKNVDMRILSESSSQSRAVLGKEAIKTIDSVRAFKSEIRSISSGDSAENQALIERLVNLRPYELQMMGMILSDRTAVDIRLDSKEHVNEERYELIRRGLRTEVVRTLGDEKAGGSLMNKALASLCSYRVREDVIILGDLSKSDLLDIDRATVIDYELLRKAFAIMDANHPESLVRSALRYSYDEVKSRSEVEGLQSNESRIGVYRLASKTIKNGDMLKEYLLKELPSEIGDEIGLFTTEQWKLCMLLLANRGAVDESLRDESKVADEDMREQITSEYISHGNVTVDEDVFINALAGIFSKRVDDAAIAADTSMSVKDALDKTDRRTDIDVQLIADAVAVVRNLALMYKTSEQNRIDSIF